MPRPRTTDASVRTTLTDELLRVGEAFGLSNQDLAGLQQNAIDAALVTPERRIKLQQALDGFLSGTA